MRRPSSGETVHTEHFDRLLRHIDHRLEEARPTIMEEYPFGPPARHVIDLAESVHIDQNIPTFVYATGILAISTSKINSSENGAWAIIPKLFK